MTPSLPDLPATATASEPKPDPARYFSLATSGLGRPLISGHRRQRAHFAPGCISRARDGQSSTLFKKLRGFHGAYFFSNSDHEKLVHGGVIRSRNAFGRLLQRLWQAKGIVTHGVVRLSSRVNQLSGRLDEAASNDRTIGVVGALLFWPALFALGGH